MQIPKQHAGGGQETIKSDGLIIVQVQLTHRIAWRRNTGAGGTCSRTTIDAQTLLQSGGPQLTCQSGCSGNTGDFSYYCTDFSITDNWSAGERTYVYNFTETFFEARYINIIDMNRSYITIIIVQN